MSYRSPQGGPAGFLLSFTALEELRHAHVEILRVSQLPRGTQFHVVAKIGDIAATAETGLIIRRCAPFSALEKRIRGRCYLRAALLFREINARVHPSM